MRIFLGSLRFTGMAARVLAGLALATTLACLSSAAGDQEASAKASAMQQAEVPAIGVVRAHLFQNKSGTWSDDMLAAANAGSWNSVAGPRSSNATLVVVEVTGPPGGTFTGYFGPETKYRLRVVATEGGKNVLLDQTQTIPILNDQGKVSIAFLLNQGGCAPVRLKVSIIGAHAPESIERSLNFACGE